MVRRVLSFTFALVLFVGGTSVALFLLLFAHKFIIWWCAGAGAFGAMGAIWLWTDFIGPWLGFEVEE